MTAAPPADGRPLRVHFFVSSVHTQGTYFRSHNLAIGLTRLGHRVTVYGGDFDTRTASRVEVRDDVRYVITPETIVNRASGWAFDPVTVVRRAAGRYPRCDVAHLFQPFPSAAGAWRRAPARVRVYDWDDLWTGGLFRGPVARRRDHWPLWLTRVLEARLPRAAHHVTAVSGFLADLARDRGAAGTTVVHNGCWPAAPADRVAARTRLGLRADALYAGFMGRTTNELAWCFDAVAANLDRHPGLRLAVCGPPPAAVAGLPPSVRERVDYLGQLSPEATRGFAAALDLGLLPLADDPFNRSRFPIKFSDHLATGVPLLCSEVGECGRLAGLFPWAVRAGATRDEWVRDFTAVVGRLARGDRPPADPAVFAAHLSWAALGRKLLAVYRAVLAGAAAPGGRP